MQRLSFHLVLILVLNGRILIYLLCVKVVVIRIGIQVEAYIVVCVIDHIPILSEKTCYPTLGIPMLLIIRVIIIHKEKEHTSLMVVIDPFITTMIIISQI